MVVDYKWLGLYLDCCTFTFFLTAVLYNWRSVSRSSGAAQNLKTKVIGTEGMLELSDFPYSGVDIGRG